MKHADDMNVNDSCLGIPNLEYGGSSLRNMAAGQRFDYEMVHVAMVQPLELPAATLPYDVWRWAPLLANALRRPTLPYFDGVARGCTTTLQEEPSPMGFDSQQQV
jgi:hypothetical protein